MEQAAQQSKDSNVAMIDLNRLLQKDDAETARLVEALEYPGYFYLDFGNAPATKDVADEARLMYTLAADYFAQSDEIKAKDVLRVPSWSDRGYKSCETDESFEISRDELRGGHLLLPAAMAEKMELVKSFHDHCDEAARAMLVQIAAALDLEALEQVHRVTEPSETGLKLISEPSVPLAANVVENKHRDSGTLTMLFYDSWSMHICLSQGGGGNDNDDAVEGQGEWVFVPPPPDGCALVHGASSLHRLSGGRLHAPLHRVTQPADGAGMRYFLSYFLRPELRLREEWDMADGSGST